VVTTAELAIRLTALVLGAGLMALGGILAHRRDGDEGCLPFLLMLAGFLIVGAGFPSEAIFR
jgi:hypothetical protein